MFELCGPAFVLPVDAPVYPAPPVVPPVIPVPGAVVVPVVRLPSISESTLGSAALKYVRMPRSGNSGGEKRSCVSGTCCWCEDRV